MDNEELIQFTQIIIRVFQQQDLEWLLEQVVESITGEDASDLSVDQIQIVLQRQENQVNVLLKLLDAIQFGILDRIAIRDYLNKFFSDNNIPDYGISTNNSVDDAETLLILDGYELALESAIQLQNIIDEIRRQISNGEN
jgi:hypothetical protein